MSALCAPARGGCRGAGLRGRQRRRKHRPHRAVRVAVSGAAREALVMDSIRAGYERIRRQTERVGDKVMKQALNSGVGSQVRHALTPMRQYTIGGRTVVEERQISEGGFAFVWAARDPRTNEELALKKIVCQDHEGMVMAKREVNILERLPSHPNVVKYYGHTVCNSEGRAKEVILLFELCTGGHLLDLLERNKGVLREERILSVFTDLCTAVAMLHTQDPPVQHRDLKVENVLLGADGLFKLCDFGSWNDEPCNPSNLDQQQISALQEHIERYTTMMYRPPEMVDFYQQFFISEKVDIWMLGCILYTLMFCRHPFQDESTLAIANARYHLPSSPCYSQRLQDLCHWLLARDPQHRPSAMELLDVLQTFGNGGALPMPAAVTEKRDQLRRLYGEQPDPGTKTIADPLTIPSKKSAKAKPHKSSRRMRRDDCTQPSDFWAQVDLQHANSDAVAWPAVAVPEPSRSWAKFDCWDMPDTSATRSLSGSSKARAASGSATLRCSSSSKRASVPDLGPLSQFPQQGRAAQLPAWTGPSMPGPWGAWEPPPGAHAPSASSRAPPPSPPAPSGAGQLLVPPGAGQPPALPLAFSGRTQHSGRSSASLRSGVSVRSGSARTERSHRSEPFAPAGATAGTSPTAGSPPGRQDGPGDFWSLAAETPDQAWDPFAQHVQWPSVLGAPRGSGGLWHGGAAGADAAEASTTATLRQGLPGSGTPAHGSSASGSASLPGGSDVSAVPMLVHEPPGECGAEAWGAWADSQGPAQPPEAQGFQAAFPKERASWPGTEEWPHETRPEAERAPDLLSSAPLAGLSEHPGRELRPDARGDAAAAGVAHLRSRWVPPDVSLSPSSRLGGNGAPEDMAFAKQRNHSDPFANRNLR
eukprot:CAMPEP_0168422872 /NCGR_PEP_ID=MMETSP0228-20121227/34017_1 /TAXON_ID=133427 /ORGANISM="Protoceratium reticulatum, Strain CCCM 535 (=CCMP 1889)" /LENGTH=873 /DNA_ID=CAMNT_0008436817 /DNA_START=8 /DNA_END=2625 /DNA_ORIENTATION=-